MKNLYAILSILLLATVHANASIHAGNNTINYTVKSGDTLSGIAYRYHTTVSKLRSANKLDKNQPIKIGKTLKVPTKYYTSTVKSVNKSEKYVIKSGDTLSGIAYRHKTTVAKLRKANGLKKNEPIKIGKVLKLSEKSYASTPQVSKYMIKKGDTLSGIAYRYKTTVANLRKINSLQKNQAIKIGKFLKVPQSKKASNQKLMASLSKLDTIAVEKPQVKKEKGFSFSDIFVSKSEKDKEKSRRMISLAKTKLGKKYVWGASGNKNTYDCSSFTKYVYKNIGISIPRTSLHQSKFGKEVKRNELKKGDLVFFDTSKKRKGYVNHVGIYLGDNKFIHASSAKKKVVITSLDKRFYSNRYKGARRPL